MIPVTLTCLLVGACSGPGDLATAYRADKPGPGDESSSSGGDPTYGASDASTSPPPRSGSPLCAVAAGECVPDDDGEKPVANGALACATAPDAGTTDSNLTKGCRVTRATSEPTGSPQCLEADRRGLDGASCEKGKDCAPGFDCVVGQTGSVCRRYCCSGSCEAQMSRNGGPTFCDVQKLVETNGLQAPVCMPIKTCKLLVDGECGDKETCAIVNEKGIAGCVPRGVADVGESCEIEHCSADLTCLGSPGDRRCYKLCKTDGSECGPMRKCTTGSVFTGTRFGVCKDE